MKLFVAKVTAVTLIATLATSTANAATVIDRYIFPWLSGYSAENHTFLECTDYWGGEESDQYDSIRFNERETVDAPLYNFEITISFDQNCSKSGIKYQRWAELVFPNGEPLQLIRDPNRSTTYEWKDEPYWEYPGSCGAFVPSCWSFKDVYGVNFTHQAPAGDYGLRIYTAWTDTVCRYEGATRICETNVAIKRTLSIPKIVTVRQTGIPAAWESPAQTSSSSSPEGNAAQTSQPPRTYQKSIATFAPGKSKLNDLQKFDVRLALRANPWATKFICTGLYKSTRTKAVITEAMNRARAACNFAKQISPGISTYAQTRPTDANSMASRVMIVLKE